MARGGPAMDPGAPRPVDRVNRSLGSHQDAPGTGALHQVVKRAVALRHMVYGYTCRSSEPGFRSLRWRESALLLSTGGVFFRDLPPVDCVTRRAARRNTEQNMRQNMRQDMRPSVGRIVSDILLPKCRWADANISAEICLSKP